jgi:hypothetical protein
VHITDKPTPIDITHDVFNRGEGQPRIRLVIHCQPDTSKDLHHQYQQRQGTHEIPEVEVLPRIIFSKVLIPHLHKRKTLINPV